MTYKMPPDLCNRPKNVINFKNTATLPQFHAPETKKAFGAIEAPAVTSGGGGMAVAVLLGAAFVILLVLAVNQARQPVGPHALKTMPDVTVSQDKPAPYSVVSDIGANVQASDTPEPAAD